MKIIPNIFTLLNLFFGCIAITLILQNGMVSTVGSQGEILLMLPEKMYLASAFIGLSAIVDFFDGLVARLCNVASEMGKQLDSLADVVSFGVAPGMIVYQFLRLAFAQHENGLDVSALWLLPAFIIPCAGAYRLARYNLDTTQTHGFKGAPIPVVGILIASFPLIYWFSAKPWVIDLLLNQWFWYAIIAVVSYLMVSTLPMIALKFKDLSLKNNLPKLIILAIAVVSALLFQWLAVPVVFVVYVIISLLMQQPSPAIENELSFKQP